MCDPNSNHGRKTPLESFYSLCPDICVSGKPEGTNVKVEEEWR